MKAFIRKTNICETTATTFKSRCAEFCNDAISRIDKMSNIFLRCIDIGKECSLEFSLCIRILKISNRRSTYACRIGSSKQAFLLFQVFGFKSPFLTSLVCAIFGTCRNFFFARETKITTSVFRKT